jgi:hypothetical protein
MVLKFGMMRTVNLGNFENVKIEFGVEMEVDKEEFGSAKDGLTVLVEEHIDSVANKYLKKSNTNGAKANANWD